MPAETCWTASTFLGVQKELHRLELSNRHAGLGLQHHLYFAGRIDGDDSEDVPFHVVICGRSPPGGTYGPSEPTREKYARLTVAMPPILSSMIAQCPTMVSRIRLHRP